MKIAFLGAGKIGTTLGTAWAAQGHSVAFGSRTPDGSRTVSHETALAGADVVVIAVPGTAVGSLITGIAADWSGRVIVDATNRFDGPSAFAELVRLVPGAKVVKAFNSVGVEVMSEPSYREGRASMLYAGDDASAKDLVRTLVADAGFDPVDLGGSETVPGLEAFVRSIWFPLSQKYGRHTGYRILTTP